MLSINHLIIRLLAQILYVLGQKGIRTRRLREQNELGTTSGKLVCNLRTNTRCATRYYSDSSVEWSFGCVGTTGGVSLEQREGCDGGDAVENGESMFLPERRQAILNHVEDEGDRHRGCCQRFLVLVGGGDY